MTQNQTRIALGWCLQTWSDQGIPAQNLPKTVGEAERRLNSWAKLFELESVPLEAVIAASLQVQRYSKFQPSAGEFLSLCRLEKRDATSWTALKTGSGDEPVEVQVTFNWHQDVYRILASEFGIKRALPE